MTHWRCGTLSRHPLGSLATEVMQAALDAVQPRALTRAWARQHLDDTPRIRVLSMGKAAAAMTQGLLDVVDDQVLSGTAVVKHTAELGRIRVCLGDHPVPGEQSLEAGAAMLEAAAMAEPGDTVIALVSGGSSALLEAPVAGISLADITAMTEARLRDGTPIEALNRARRRGSRIKGGGLARAIPKGVTVHVVVLSDVLDANPHIVGSGPFDDARVQSHLLADNARAVEAAASAARALGAEVEVTLPMRREARVEGARWAQKRMMAPPTDAVRCTLAGAETVVTVRGDGQGGRNQEFALSAAPALMSNPHALLVSLATDGEDGSTDAAGAAVDGTTVLRALERGLDPDDHLRRNDSYAVFDALDDLLRPGPTGTNVCDLALAFS
ncbi:MAG: glycerate kinase type-2 family protein [Nannocystales bacterium]